MMKTLSSHRFWCVAFGISLLSSLVETLQFAKTHDTAVVPVDFPANTSFYETYVLVSVNAGVSFETRPNFFLKAPSNEVALRPSSSGYGVQLYLLDALQLMDVDRSLIVVCVSWTGSASTPCLNVTLRVLPIGTDHCRPAAALCFGTSLDSPLVLPENGVVHQNVVRLSQPVYDQPNCRLESPSYNYTSFSGTLLVEKGVLVLNKRMNGDEIRNFTFELGCNVTTGDGVRHSLRKRSTVHVSNTNDHGPEPSEALSRIIINNTKDFTYKILSVRDHDVRLSPYKVELHDDPLQLFSLTINDKHFFPGMSAWLIAATVGPRLLVRPLDFPANSYTISVRFIDTTLTTTKNLSNELVYTLTFLKHGHAQPTNPSVLNDLNGNEFNATVSLNAAINSRVLQPIDPNATFHAGVIFYLDSSVTSSSSSQLPFNVTPSEGIIYVNDTDRLKELKGVETIIFRLAWRARTSQDVGGVGDEAQGHLSITVRLVSPDIEGAGNVSCEGGSGHNAGVMCSMSGSETTCETSCGLSAGTGFCRWRLATQYRYATCSPDLRTCPDKVCDELEATFYYICPQDCVESDEVHGVHFSSGQPHGINNGRGTCTCDSFRKCSCDASKLEGLHPEDEVDKDDGRLSSSSTSSHSPTVDNVDIDRAVEDDVCGVKCFFLIFLPGMVLVVLLVVSYVHLRRRCKNCASNRGHKYPNRDNSVPAVPSDYVVDERSSSSVVATNIIILQDILSIANKNIQAIESEWEFPRSKLLLEQTLGEGEFGRVMRAKALDINGQSGYTTVAVKMSKCVGSSAELDLLQEFNLLKEVVHPNVIRVLGACSSCKDGPLFIIVEYAEFGSLRVYLRKTRRFEFESCTSDDSGVDSLANGGGTLTTVTAADHMLSEYQVNPRDLLQFAWQIAKGMAYLGEMKLVHRDLASRNILVAAGKVIKISDFGLTRDVYEGDTYFKKSTGRVPVKWMAIESLDDHVYTTKSDVWSFGIVLWEIITLGAAPYPGVPPETLYRLLKSGYRMEKPDNCSEELYKIMRRCWHEFPHERPSFVELRRTFDDMLEANVEYLDLVVNMVHNMTYFEDTTTGQTIDESEMGYGSWNALQTDDGDYLQSSCRKSSNVEEDEEVAFLLTKGSTALSKNDDHVV